MIRKEIEIFLAVYSNIAIIKLLNSVFLLGFRRYYMESP